MIFNFDMKYSLFFLTKKREGRERGAFFLGIRDKKDFRWFCYVWMLHSMLGEKSIS